MKRTNHTNYNPSNLHGSNVAAVILAGGKSDRMNFPKPFLPFDSKRTFIEKIVNDYKDFGCKKIVLVLNEDLKCEPWDEILSDLSNDVFIIYNRHSDLGRFYSVHLGIKSLGGIEYCFIQNVDSPFIDSTLLKKLFDSKTNYGYVVPEYKGKGGHPILIGNKIINSIDEEENISINLKDKLRQFKRKSVDVGSERVLMNINTFEQYQGLFDNGLIQRVSLKQC